MMISITTIIISNMANYLILKTAIQNVIRTNGNNEITGATLQQTLISMIDSLGAGYLFMGIATPSTEPGEPDQNVFYIAGPGDYDNFGPTVSIQSGSLGIFVYTSGAWESDEIMLTYREIEENLLPLGNLIGSGYVNERGEFISYSNYTSYEFTDLSTIEKIRCSSTVGNRAVRYIWMSGSAVISYEMGSNPASYQTVEVAKPAGATKLLICYEGSTYQYLNIKKVPGGDIQIVNNLNDGGVDKALSAEMGRVLAEKNSALLALTMASERVNLLGMGQILLNKYLSSSLVETDLVVAANPYVLLKITDLSTITKINITAGVGASAYVYAWLDANRNLLEGHLGASGDAAQTFTSSKPANAAILYIGFTLNRTYQLFAEINNLISGKKICFLGDSITAQGLYVSSFVGITGCIAQNYGVSGCHLSQINAEDNNACSVRYANMADDASGVIVFAGTNDFGHTNTAPFGDFSDGYQPGVYTFFSGLHKLCKGLSEKYRGRPVAIVTPVHHGGSVDTPEYSISSGGVITKLTNPTTGKTFEEYVNAIDEVAKFYSIPVLRADRDSLLTPITEPSGQHFYFSDGLHLSSAGGQKFAAWLWGEYRKVIYNLINY